jgi:hypothetical protein|tara:strand:- start:174 stop:566 length:393 start_codon:yes stop_codon:yes gene_type:complete
MEKQKYTLSIEITSSTFPNHPHLAMKVAKRMWSLGHDTQSISNQIGTDGQTIQRIARLEEWKREKRTSVEGCRGYWGPFLTTEEERELPESDWSGTDHPDAVKPEPRYRQKINESYSAPSTLAWIEDTYK